MIRRYQIVPITGRKARFWIAEHHRHLPRLQGALFGVGVALDDQIVAVGCAGNPPRVWQGSRRLVISRVAALPDLPPVIDGQGEIHAAPACTMIYRALCDAARCLGYREAWTYSLPDEDGRSIKAAGFRFMGETDGGEWDCPTRPRGRAADSRPKGRWVRDL